MPPTINHQNFLDFYDKNVAKVYRYVYFRVGSKQLAQDLTSETFLRTWEYLKNGKDIGNLSAMTFQICRNLIADNFRNSHIELPINAEIISEKNLTESEKKLVTDSENKLEIARIKAKIALLRAEYQEIIIWRYIDDFSIEEIAQIWGRTPGSVRTMLSRALKALRGVLDKEDK